MTYRLSIQPGVKKQMRRLPLAAQTAIAAAIDSLANAPRPHGCIKLTNRMNQYRIRSGNYRIVYEIHDAIITVIVVDVGHRKDIYR